MDKERLGRRRYSIKVATIKADTTPIRTLVAGVEMISTMLLIAAATMNHALDFFSMQNVVIRHHPTPVAVDFDGCRHWMAEDRF